ncbi:probable glutamate receptor [Hylaeus volcanicus]|uniref:probable glutamate receptor n=1 Tax=Hylaeus volcanicus TaxID=313075 RepID=UPI0023B7A0C3|nr:probable glutamate receptor [Hylaeus volcanicus]
MKGLLLLATMQVILRPTQSANGAIWDKRTQDFVPIFGIPDFAAIKQEILDESRAKETHNFQGRVVKFSYFEITNLVNRNGNRITGAIGEVWNTLSEYLNFTLKPILVTQKSLGFPDFTGTYRSGLLNIIRKNETDVIPRLEAIPMRLVAVQFSIPLWRGSFRLYARRDIQHNPTWMVKIFSRKVWYAILSTYFLLCLCSYLAQMMESKITRRKLKTSLVDVFFYNFGTICDQNYLPSSLSKSLRIVEFCLGLFSCLLRIAFGALLIVYLTQTNNTPPFHDLKSLLDDSSYNILCLKGSMNSAAFKLFNDPTYKKLQRKNRVKYFDTEEEMYKMACAQGTQNAIFQSVDIKMAAGSYICHLNPTGYPLHDGYSVSGISRSFSYKKSIDIGILRLYEVGIMALLKRRWIEPNNVNEFVANETEPIIMEQVYLILLIFAFGMLISFNTLILEILIFYYSN